MVTNIIRAIYKGAARTPVVKTAMNILTMPKGSRAEKHLNSVLGARDTLARYELIYGEKDSFKLAKRFISSEGDNNSNRAGSLVYRMAYEQTNDFGKALKLYRETAIILNDLGRNLPLTITNPKPTWHLPNYRGEEIFSA